MLILQYHDVICVNKFYPQGAVRLLTLLMFTSLLHCIINPRYHFLSLPPPLCPLPYPGVNCLSMPPGFCFICFYGLDVVCVSSKGSRVEDVDFEDVGPSGKSLDH